MTRVYVDTSALLPLLDRDDDDHGRVVEAVARLGDQGATLVTASYTLVETGALVRRRLGMEAYRTLGSVLRRAFEVVWVDAELHHRAWAESAAGARRGPSLVDVVGFLVMDDLGLTTALALDRHFADRGFDLLPS